MKAFLPVLLACILLTSTSVSGQYSTIDKVQFFNDTSILHATISTDLGKLLRQKKTGSQFPAIFSFALPDGIIISDPILLEIRGHYRKDNCYLPPLKVDFKYQNSSILHKLGSLKLVSECKTAEANDQYLLKEFITYKIYNLLTDISFHVRLLNLNLVDSTRKKKTITEHAFLIEDIKDVAKRNNCVDWENVSLFSEDTDRWQMTMVAIFQYMIGNTDWGVPVNHNTRLIVSKIDSLRRPFVVPYDFDYSGFVNTDYAVPDERLPIQSVRERFYQGFPRTMEELNPVLDIFKQQKENIYALINNFSLLTSRSKKDMIGYLDDFYYQVGKPDIVKHIFIQNARTR